MFAAVLAAVAFAGAAHAQSSLTGYPESYSTCPDELRGPTRPGGDFESNSLLSILQPAGEGSPLKNGRFSQDLNGGDASFIYDLIMEFNVTDDVWEVLRSETGNGVGGYTLIMPANKVDNPFKREKPNEATADVYNMTVADWTEKYNTTEEAKMWLSELIKAHVFEGTWMQQELIAAANTSASNSTTLTSLQGYVWTMEYSAEFDALLVVPDDKYFTEYGMRKGISVFNLESPKLNTPDLACPNLVYPVKNYMVIPELLTMTMPPPPAPNVTVTVTEPAPPSDPVGSVATPTDTPTETPNDAHALTFGALVALVASVAAMFM